MTPKQGNTFDCGLHVLAAARGVEEKQIFKKISKENWVQMFETLYDPEHFEKNARKEIYNFVKSQLPKGIANSFGGHRWRQLTDAEAVHIADRREEQQRQREDGEVRH